MNDLEIASYLDRGMSVADRDRVEDHMADCSECRRNVAEAQQLVGKARRPRRLVAFGGLAAVAAAALVIFVPQLPRQAPPLDRVTRDVATLPPLAVYEPTGNVERQPTRFVWAAAQGAASYQITLSATDGTTLWTATVTDTIATLPASVSLDPRTRYVWFVDATLPDGTAQTTGLRELNYQPRGD